MAPLKLDLIRERFNISRLAIQHSWLTVCCWIVVAVAGLFAFSSLKYALFPDITFPVVVVNATASPENALASETQLTIPLENQLESIEGLNKILSSTSAGRTVMNLRFAVGSELAASTEAIEAAIARTNLPTDTSYEVIPLNLNEATAVTYAIVAEEPSLSLEALADITEADILPVLEDTPGVLRVDLLGIGTRLQTEQGDGEGSFLSNLQNPPTLVRYESQAALAVEVVKEETANTLEVVDQVEAALRDLQPTLSDIQVIQAATQAGYIRAATQATIDSLLGAVLIAVLVILGFLRSWRATLITALAIPLSLLGTCIVMALYNFNLETITLLALALVIGIIVDDAIVEIENIVRHIELGLTPRQAALKATEEIGLTVSASTLTIVAVFLPVAFMGGTVGQFFKPFGLTVSAAVLTSLLAARTLSPVLAVYWLKPRQTKLAPAAAAAGSVSDRDQAAIADGALPPPTVAVSPLERGYSRVLLWALRYRWRVVAIAIASFIVGISIIPLIPKGFIHQLDRGEFYLNYTAPLPQLATPAEALNSDLAIPPTEATATLAQTSDPSSNPDLLPEAVGQTEAAAALAANPTEMILENTLDAVDVLETTVFDLPETTSILTVIGGRGRPNEGSLYIRLGQDRDRKTAAVQTELREQLPESGTITTSVEDIQFVDTGEKPLKVALLGEDVLALKQAAADVKSEVVAMAGFADVQITGEANTEDAIVEINRQNGQRVAYVSANLSDGKALGDATDTVVDIAKSIIPDDIQIDLGGDSARIGEVLRSFGRTLIFAVICMLGVLIIPFGRLLEPAVVGLSLPLSVTGAMLALLVIQSEFGIVSLLGLLFLLGLLDKNALLLMDYANQLRRSGLKRSDAILETGLVRLRPILMTTASTILGMVPIALGLGAGAELRQPMAVAIIGGLLTSTLLSLIVVPVLYTLLEDIWSGLTQKSH